MLTSLYKIIFILSISVVHICAYSFSMNIDKTTPLVGEKCTLTLNLSYVNLEEYEIDEPYFENFDLLLKEDKESKNINGTWQVKQIYQITPRKAGTFRLDPLKTHIEMIEVKYQKLYNKNKYLKKFDIFTKSIMMKVEPLPQDLTITGDYQLYSNIDKNLTHVGKPIHFTIGIKGEGNIPNLDFLTLNIPDVTIYEKTVTKFEKSFDILANKSFTIPPIMLRYYNQKTEQINLLSTAPFDIKVTGSKAKERSFKIFWWFIFPFISILQLLWFIPKLFVYDEKKSLKKQLKLCKDKDKLLKKLMPYLYENRQLTKLIYQLEEVENRDFKKLKKEILKHF